MTADAAGAVPSLEEESGFARAAGSGETPLLAGKQLFDHLPHRPPFLFVDRVLAVGEEYVVFEFDADPAHDFYQGTSRAVRSRRVWFSSSRLHRGASSGRAGMRRRLQRAVRTAQAGPISSSSPA